MKVAIHQPENMPWLGFFNKMDKCNIFVILDDVQFMKNGFQNRNKIKAANGPQWLTTPVEKTNHKMIKDIKIDNRSNWKASNLKSIMTNYAKAKYYQRYIPFFKELYSKEWYRLIDFNMAVITFFAEEFGIDSKIIMSSELDIHGTKTMRLINICKKLHASTYLSGLGAKDYMEEDLFTKNNIKLEYIKFIHPTYPQLFGEFMPNASVIDILMNYGPKCKKILGDSI